MNRPASFFLSSIRVIVACVASACACVVTSQGAEKKPAPPIWPGADTAPVVRDLMPIRILTGDDVWKSSIAPFLDVDPGSSPRNILLPAIGGSDGVVAGRSILARVHMPAGLRVMIRDAEGGLLGMINGGDTASVQWVTLRAQSDRWDVRVSPSREVAATDPSVLWGGAQPVVAPSGAEQGVARPTNPRTSGYSLRFETDAPTLVLNSSGERLRLRIIADDRVVSVVDTPATRSGRASAGVNLGEPRRRRVELLIDEGALRSIELADVRYGVFPWTLASPKVRMLVLADDAAGSGTQGYSWAAASRLDFECWSLAWGDGASRLGVAAGSLAPEELIAEDIAAADADVVVVGGRIMDIMNDGDDYADHVGRWLDAVSRAARPDAVKIVLPGFSIDGDKRARVIEKAAKQRGFIFINWQGWISEDEAGPWVELGGQTPNAAGHVYLGGRLAEEFLRLDIGGKARPALIKRTMLSGSR